MRRLTGCVSNSFKPLTLQVWGGEKGEEWKRGGACCAGPAADEMEECNMESRRSLKWEKGVKSIKWYYWPLKLIEEVAVKGPRHGEDARCCPCCSLKAVFSLHAALSMQGKGGFFRLFNGSHDFNDCCPDLGLNDPCFRKGWEGLIKPVKRNIHSLPTPHNLLSHQ